MVEWVSIFWRVQTSMDSNPGKERQLHNFLPKILEIRKARCSVCIAAVFSYTWGIISKFHTHIHATNKPSLKSLILFSSYKENSVTRHKFLAFIQQILRIYSIILLIYYINYLNLINPRGEIVIIMYECFECTHFRIESKYFWKINSLDL